MKISLFTPTNNSQWLAELYDCLAKQSWQDWQWVILLNNGAKYTNDDTRVVIVEDSSSTPNVGHLKHLACKYCTGDVLLEMDHDDLLLPEALTMVAKAFADPKIDFVYSNTINHDVRTDQPVIYDARFGWTYRDVALYGKPYKEAISADPLPQSISRIWFAPNHLRAWRASFYWKIGGHNPTLKIADDLDLIRRTFIHGNMLHINEPLYLYRVHGANTWLKHQNEIQTEMWRVHNLYIADMAKRWSKDNQLRCIDLCGGVDPAKGFESVDLNNADIQTDLNLRWPFNDDSIGLIRAHDAIEHLRNPIHTMNEAWRVLAHGGFLLIIVPSTEGVGAWCDPTHVSFWNWRSFRYYTEAAMRRYIEPQCVCRFQVIKVENILHHDNIPYVQAHLIALKKDEPRFFGELLI